MPIPNAHKAIIAPEKLHDYLLNIAHRRGAAKARLLLALGYRTENWKRLEYDIRQQHLTCDPVQTSQTEYGVRFEILAPIRAPNGRSIPFWTIWQIDTGRDVPRLITMYAE